MRNLLLIVMLLLGSSKLYATEVQTSDENFFEKRKMFSLKPEYRNQKQILITTKLSSVLEYAGRSILVVRSVDGAEVPFYRSTGKNSGLPETWLPFFGLRKDWVVT